MLPGDCRGDPVGLAVRGNAVGGDWVKWFKRGSVRWAVGETLRGTRAEGELAGLSLGAPRPNGELERELEAAGVVPAVVCAMLWNKF